MHKDFYDISLIVPLNDSAQMLIDFLLNSKKMFRKNGVELIVVTDLSFNCQDLKAILDEYPLLNLKVIQYKIVTKNYAILLSIGIKYALFSDLLIINPLVVFETDVVSLFKKKKVFYNNTYFLASKDGEIGYDCLLVAKKEVLKVNGFINYTDDLEITLYDLSKQLEFIGIKKFFFPEASYKLSFRQVDLRENIEHFYFKNVFRKNRSGFYHDKVAISSENIDILFDYNRNFLAYAHLLKYLKKFPSYYIVREKEFTTNRKIVALVNTFNESNHITELFRNLEPLCDGIILLDDGSVDNTYELATSHKLLLKVKKERQNKIQERDIRNILLDITFFVSSEWFFFIDADERLEEGYSDLYSVCKSSPSDSVLFYLVHLWDSEYLFRTDIPEKSPIHKDGIIARWRMFRKYGHLQIENNNQIHIPAIPYMKGGYSAPILLRHYGVFNQETRRLKFLRYNEWDPLLADDPSKYDYLNDTQVELSDIRQVKLPS